MNLLFLDIETTGLDPKQDYILELAMLLYNTTTDKIEYSETGFTTFQKKIYDRLELNPYVKDMHTQNGLLNAYMLNSENANEEFKYYGIVLNEIDKLLSKKEYLNNCMLAGSSVHFDVSFLNERLGHSALIPAIFDKLHYRRMDVSVLWAMWDELIPGLPETNHRALSDCHRSLAIYKYFKSKRLV